MQGILHHIAYFFGFANNQEAGSNYAFWSGFGSDLGEVTLIGFFVGAARKHNCHQKGCWRIGKHVHEGTPYCTKHHPLGV